jgi:hypothetical protein
MGTKSRDTIYGGSVRASAERAAEARKVAGRLACEAWNKRMLGFQGPAQPSPALGDALNAGYLYLEVKCLGCNAHQTVALDIVRRPKTTPSTNSNGICGARIARRSGAIIQAQPCSGAAANEDFSQRSAVNGGPANDEPEPMCNLYSITTNQAAIAALFPVMNRYVGNLAPMPGVFPDYPAPVVRNAGAERELTMMRWGSRRRPGWAVHPSPISATRRHRTGAAG